MLIVVQHKLLFVIVIATITTDHSLICRLQCFFFVDSPEYYSSTLQLVVNTSVYLTVDFPMPQV